MNSFIPTPHGDKDSGRWPTEDDVPRGAVLQCRLKSPQTGYYYVIAPSANAIPDHRNIVAWASIPEPIEIAGKPIQPDPTGGPEFDHTPQKVANAADPI